MPSYGRALEDTGHGNALLHLSSAAAAAAAAALSS